MSPANVFHLYRIRLRARWFQESLAIVGIAAGVALLFASQISSASLQSSVRVLARGIAGDATIQLLARAPQGFPESILPRVRALPGVRLAAPVLEAGAQASGPRGSAPVQMIGADSSLSKLGGLLVRHADLRPFGRVGAIALPAPLARTIGVSGFGQEVILEIAGHRTEAPLYERLSASQIGPLAASSVAIVPLFFAQELTGRPARLSRILIRPQPGAQARVRSELATIADGKLNVAGIDYEERLFATAAAASSQSTALFAAISALVGFLFAFNAVLFTVPQRRRLIADLRRDGYTPRTVTAVLAFDALVLGLIACALGLVLGDELSIHVLHSDPAFLSLAFAVGDERAIDAQIIALALAGGMLAAAVAVLVPLREILARDPHDRAPRLNHGAPRLGPGWMALAGAACFLTATAILLAAPDAAIPGMVLLVAALLLVLPFALRSALALTARVARRFVGAVPHIATMELGSAGARALAIAATGAVAIFGSVAIQGAHGDLLAGLERSARETNAAADVVLAPAGSYNLLSTTPFAPARRRALERLPGVRAVGLYRGGLLDYGARRALVMAPPAGFEPLLATGQLLSGEPRLAEARVRAGGWAMLSQALAAEHGLHVGQAFTLPSPDPTRLRVAALSTNLGWAPGAIVISASTYAHAWASSEASAYEIALASGFPPARAMREIRDALGPGSGLAVQSTAQRTAAQDALSRQALSRLTQIAALIPIAAVLAMAAALGAMIWQRRPRLAKLKLEGLAHAQLWHTILFESVLLLSVGCLIGALFGLYGQQLADRALAQTINFPVLYSVTAMTAFGSLVLVTATATAILAVPGYLAASVPAALALQE
ncbi:MAG TPA: FtsX-like permease family protein [Solirubrobacteraceae bacterium]|nr:FtsX-like permease family protein [Solirubrobacteraceae bacterium]